MRFRWAAADPAAVPAAPAAPETGLRYGLDAPPALLPVEAFFPAAEPLPASWLLCDRCFACIAFFLAASWASLRFRWVDVYQAYPPPPTAISAAAPIIQPAAPEPSVCSCTGSGSTVSSASAVGSGVSVGVSPPSCSWIYATPSATSFC